MKYILQYCKKTRIGQWQKTIKLSKIQGIEKQVYLYICNYVINCKPNHQIKPDQEHNIQMGKS